LPWDRIRVPSNGIAVRTVESGLARVTVFYRGDDHPAMKVLLGIGGSEDSLRALEKTVRRSIAAGDELAIALVENPRSDMTVDELETRVEEVLAEYDLDAEVRALSGHPGSRLVDVAETDGYEMIVLGGGETSPMGKITMGQIAEFVLLNSHVSVKLVR
jgi:nucleotide-binding universal stress UspA family protein